MQQRILQQNERLSAYMDGQDVEFVSTLTESPELQQKWASYHAIRSVMQGDEYLLGNDFSAKMAALLEDEEIERLPAEKTAPKGLVVKLKRWSTPILQAGIAASVCLMAVLGVNYMNSGDEVAQTQQPVLQTLPFTNSAQAVSYNAPAHAQPTAEQLEVQQRKINALLENHELQRRTNNVTLSEGEKVQTSSNSENENMQK